jgi:AGZA family xanthine/uracil permease-like MFS transporter
LLQWFIRAAQGSLWRRDGHAVFEDEDVVEGARSMGGSEKELVEVVIKSTGKRQTEDIEAE